MNQQMDANASFDQPPAKTAVSGREHEHDRGS